MPTKIEILVSGHGGQGVILFGQILGKAAVYAGRNALQTQTYGAEARGSLARSEIIISEGKIHFPAVRNCDILVTMNHEALIKHVKRLKKDGILIVDSSIVRKIPKTTAKIFKIAATQTAKNIFGDALFANLIILGAFTKITNLVNNDAMIKAIRESVPPKTVDVNINAYTKGQQLLCCVEI